MEDFKKFTSLESFAHVYRSQDYFDKKAVVYYGAKIKLHGTNAGIRIDPDGTVTAQSRTQDITPEADNAGFARWVEGSKDAWSGMEFADTIVVYGEWAGKGIQKGDAVCSLNQKYFFVFGILHVASDLFIIDPEVIENLLPDHDDVITLPWDVVFPASVDFNNPEECERFAEMLSDDVVEVGECDPFIHAMFDIVGPGEGWVISPICNAFEEPSASNTTAINMEWYRTLTFKVKTEAHAVKKSKPATKDIEVPESVTAFVEMFVTEARCEQGLNEIGVHAAPEMTGEFLKWIGQDVKKEGDFEMKDAGLEWKDVTKPVQNAAKKWWMKECQKVT